MNQLQIIQKEVVSVQPFLEYVSKQLCNKHDGPQDWATLLIDKAYEVEYVVDACIRKELPHWCLEHWLSDIIEDITFIRTMIEIDQEKKHFNPVSHDTMDIANCQISPLLSKAPSMNEEIIGFEDVREELKNKLLKGCRELDVISIVGMPGLGKTTLAKKLFYDKSIVEHFDIRAQCCVSRVYTRMDLLITILHDATGERPRFSTEADAAVKLRKALIAKRYLILVDDVWEASVWDDLSLCFHDAKNRSRIILTTRHFEVANYASSVSKPVPLRMFNNDESWKLLEDRVFGKQRCPASLEEVGQQIAKKCRGLPLSIVLVAGILAKTEKKEESWKQVATTLSSQIHNDSKAILEQSYQDLPCHLKPCFLYFGAYLEDRVIDVSTLTRLWISEAFIKSCEGKRLEDIAEGYLENLIERNLVMVSQRADSDGKVKACRIHDVLLEFCKKRATEENFLLWIKRDDNAKQHAQRRLAFSEVDNLEEWSSSCSRVSSILFRNDTTYFVLYGVSFRTYEISRILHNFKFLKVLDLELTLVIDFFPIELVYLRYLSARIDQHSLPSSIANLWNLETLILICREQEGDLSVPITIWKMVKLIHLCISNRCFTIENAEELLEDSSKLYDLETLSSPYFSCPEDAKLMLKKTPNVRKLTCKFKGIHRDCKFPVLNFPTRLEALVIFGPEEEEPDVYPVCISASNLKDLTLFKFRLGHQHLSNIAQLQNLQELQLRFIEFDNLEWEVSNDDDFPQLKVLTLSNCFFSKWSVSADAFNNLERLVLHFCSILDEIPSCFGDISSLKSIAVYYCNEYVDKSARDIQETQVEDYQNTNFKLEIMENKYR